MILENILSDHKLKVSIENEIELTLIQGSSAIFLEMELEPEDVQLIEDSKLIDVLLKAFRTQIETDLDCLYETIGIAEDDTENILSYTRECFYIYNDLIAFKLFHSKKS